MKKINLYVIEETIKNEAQPQELSTRIVSISLNRNKADKKFEKKVKKFKKFGFEILDEQEAFTRSILTNYIVEHEMYILEITVH